MINSARGRSFILGHAVLLAGFCFIAWTLVHAFHLNTLSFVFQAHWQFLDRPELARAPLESLLDLHSQPPLLNAIVWALGADSPALYERFVILNAICAGLTAFILYHIVAHYLKHGAALIIALLYLITPPTLLNIAYPFYPCLTALGYALMVYAFHCIATRPKLALAAFVIAISYLTLLRSSFSPLHTVFFCALFYYFSRATLSKKQLACGFIIALILALAVPIKNHMRYGFFGASSWAPLNLSQGLGIQNSLGGFPTPTAIKKAHPEISCTHTHGPQDSKLIKSDGAANYNSCLMIPYGKHVGSEIPAHYTLQNHLRNIATSTLSYFAPPYTYHFLKNREAIPAYLAAADIFYLDLHLTPYREIRVLLLLILALATYTTLKTRDPFLTACLIILLVHYTTHSLTDGGEGNRFIYDLEFLFYVMAAASAYCIPRLRKH